MAWHDISAIVVEPESYDEFFSISEIERSHKKVFGVPDKPCLTGMIWNDARDE
jgi:hypothetical protein